MRLAQIRIYERRQGVAAPAPIPQLPPNRGSFLGRVSKGLRVPGDAPRVGPAVKVEVGGRAAGDLVRREVFEVADVDGLGGVDSGFVKGNEESVSGESAT